MAFAPVATARLLARVACAAGVVLPLLVALGAATATPLHAQGDQARGDSLLRRGRMFAAESAYYAAARRTPRSPAVRLALGRYLAARGALKVGAVLMEEARFFGAEADIVAMDLAPVYARLGDFRSLAALPGSPLAAGERARVAWLRDHAPSATGADSVTLDYVPADDRSLGQVALVIGGERVNATIDPSINGLVLDTLWTKREGSVRVFPGAKNDPAARTPGVVGAVEMGGLTLSNVPVRFMSSGEGGGVSRGRIGLDVLGDLLPTFDAQSRKVTLRRNARTRSQPLPHGGTRVATLALPTGLFVNSEGSVWALAGDRGRAVVKGRRWTLDARRGQIIIAN